MKKVALFFISIFAANFMMSQNVGIGVANPLYGKLHVASSDNISQGLFGALGSGGISIDNNEPLVGFNLYTNGSRRFMSNGFGSILYMERNTGKLRYNVSNATGLADASVPAFTSLLAIQADGNVGIGTTSPTEARLQIHEPAGNTQFIAAAGSNLPGISTFVPSTSPSIGFNVRYQAGLKFMGPGYGGYWQFSPTLGKLYYYYSGTSGIADGSVSAAFGLVIDSSGRMGIGTSIPTAPLHVTGNVVFGSSSIDPATGYKLSVDGKIICEELKVQLNTDWPDYVFDDAYPLPSLESLETKVMATKHLPGIPSASDVKAQQGIELGDMQKRLLEKIEEMYRYMFRMNKENKLLKAELDALKSLDRR
ncbi:MAG: hypothetical protein H7Z13_15205 [Ferruginibacter sp.]|nr:hypothetical protein [Ferruginibacter sp.]